MLPLGILERQLSYLRAVTESQLNTRGDVTVRTSEVLSVSRHWLATREAPGVLLSLLLPAFGF